MTKEEIKAKIQSEIEKTTQKIAAYTASSKPVSPDDAIGRVSRMDAINNKSVTESALRHASSKLRKLQAVLTQVDEVGFGLCKKCKQTIPLGRIIIQPESDYCVKCAR